MKQKNILVLNSNSSFVTGGQFYDSFLYKTILNVSPHRIEFCKEKLYRNGINFTKILAPLLELTLLKKFKNKDICILNSSLAYRHFLLLLIARIFLSRKKMYVIHHHYQYEVLLGLKKIVYKFFELGFLKLANSIIIPNPYVLIRTKELLPKSSISYLETSFKANEYSTTRKEIKKGELLYIGTIEYRKGLHLLLDSLASLKNEKSNFCLNIIGSIVDNNYYIGLLNKITSFGLEKHVVFHGRVTSEILHDLLMKAELFVFPSLLEGYGVVIMEAMSYGIPVIAFNNSAMPYTIKDGFNGFLAKNKDTADFKMLIEKVIDNPIIRSNLSEGALMTFKNSRRESDLINDIKEFVLKM